MDPVYFGAVFPDIDYMSATRIKSNKFDLHQMNDLDEKSNKKRENIEFGKKLVENARTREEKAFALGYLSHLIVDRRVHETLDAIEISPIDQFIIECYLTTQHRFNKSIFIQKFPAKLFERTLNNSVSNYNHVNYSALKIKDFSFKNYLLNAYIREKFISGLYYTASFCNNIIMSSKKSSFSHFWIPRINVLQNRFIPTISVNINKIQTIVFKLFDNTRTISYFPNKSMGNLTFKDKTNEN